MEIIKNKLNEAVFLKEDSIIQKQIDELKELPDYSNNEEIKNQIKLLEIGLRGEENIKFELDHSDIGMYVLHDITIKDKEKKAQIDYIIVTSCYIYIVECKNLYGDISIDKTGQFIRKYNNKTESIYSPYTQAVRHKVLLKKIKLKQARFLSRFFLNNYFDGWYKPLVILSNSKSILNKNYAPEEIKNNVIKVDQLINYIKKDLHKHSKAYSMSQKEMLETADSLLKMNVDEYNSFANKYKEALKNNNESLKERLISFRKEKAKEKNIPAYYIFTNDELERILNSKPKCANELKGILSETKVKFHGDEIIDIINKF